MNDDIKEELKKLRNDVNKLLETKNTEMIDRKTTSRQTTRGQPKQQVRVISKNDSFLQEQLNELKNEIYMLKNNSNSNNSLSFQDDDMKILIDKIDGVISTKFVELNKVMTEYIVNNASHLVFSNKSFCDKLENWIRTLTTQE